MGEKGSQVRTDGSIQDSILTTTQRKFLQSNISNTDRSTTTRARIRERVSEGLRDFRLLAAYLEERDQKQIFNAARRTPEYQELQGDVQSAIAFTYAGLRGEAGFRDPLRRGVRQGEVSLGNIKAPLQIEPRFALDFVSSVDGRATVETVENEQWDRLSDKSLLWFVRAAKEEGAIDFDKVYERVEHRETVKGWADGDDTE